MAQALVSVTAIVAASCADSAFAFLAPRIPFHRSMLIPSSAAMKSPSSIGLGRVRAGNVWLASAEPRVPLLLLNVCSGPSCKASCFRSLSTAVAERFGDKVAVGEAECFNACKRFPSVRAVKPDGTNTALPGMNSLEASKFCFNRVKEDEPDERVLEIVRQYVEQVGSL